MNGDIDMNTQCNSANMNSDIDMNTQCNSANMNSDTDMNTRCNSANTNSVLDDRHSSVNILATTPTDVDDGGGSPATENLLVHSQSAMSNCVPTCVPNACKTLQTALATSMERIPRPTRTTSTAIVAFPSGEFSLWSVSDKVEILRRKRQGSVRLRTQRESIYSTSQHSTTNERFILFYFN